jgi:hypothetical protein
MPGIMTMGVEEMAIKIAAAYINANGSIQAGSQGITGVTLPGNSYQIDVTVAGFTEKPVALVNLIGTQTLDAGQGYPKASVISATLIQVEFFIGESAVQRDFAIIATGV